MSEHQHDQANWISGGQDLADHLVDELGWDSVLAAQFAEYLDWETRRQASAAPKPGEEGMTMISPERFKAWVDGDRD